VKLPFGYELRLTRATGPLTPVPERRRYRGSWPVVREPYTGAWQKNEEIALSDVTQNPTVFACATLIAETIGKCRLRLVSATETDLGTVWTDTTSPAYSPVLRKPNRYQSIQKFVELWIASKLLHGNTYVLKQRDGRGVVVALYVLDPTKVTPLVAPDGAVYYQLGRDDLNGLTPDRFDPNFPAVPARELIHDLMVPLFHPLVGVSPIYACGLAALQGLRIQESSTTFFANGSQPSGVLTSPLPLTEQEADAILENWYARHGGTNVGKAAVLDAGMKYEATAQSAADAQLIDQLHWSDETIAGCFHVPIGLVNTSKATPAANSEQATQQFYSQCLQAHMTALEFALDDGLELIRPYGTEFAIDDLIWLDSPTRTKAAVDAIGSGAMTPNEARYRYFGLGPVDGGDTPYMQQQNYSLTALAERDQDQPFSKPPPATPAVSGPLPADDDDLDDDDLNAAFRDAFHKALSAEDWYAAA
jgi:HK97 family phage portal protein